MKTKETFTTSTELVAAYLLAKGVKMKRIEVVPDGRYADTSYHFAKEEAEELLNAQNRLVDFTDLKVEHDLLCIEASHAKDEFKKAQGGAL